MASIHDIFKDECVRGDIFGGDYVCAKLCYDNRQQGRVIYADSNHEARLIAAELKNELISDLGDFLKKEIYPDDQKWRLVFLN